MGLAAVAGTDQLPEIQPSWLERQDHFLNTSDSAFVVHSIHLEMGKNTSHQPINDNKSNGNHCSIVCTADDITAKYTKSCPSRVDSKESAPDRV